MASQTTTHPTYGFLFLGMLGFLLFHVSSGFSQSVDLQFRRLAIEEGLSGNSTYGVAQDTMGMIWISGSEGLNQYDGFRVKTFLTDPDNPYSITANTIAKTVIDSKGKIWVCTYGGGLNLYDQEKDQFYAYRHIPGDSTSLANDYVTDLYEDHAGRFWVGTQSGFSQAFIDDRKIRFEHFPSIAGDSTTLSYPIVNSICEYPPGVLWIATDKGGINRFDTEKRTFTHYKRQKEDPYSLSGNIVKELFLDTLEAHPSIWVATSHGLNRFWLDQNGGIPRDSFVHFRHDPNDPTSIPGDEVLTVLRDKGGTVWVGTYGKGLAWFDPLNPEAGFTVHRHEEGKNNSLANDIVWNIFEDRDGLLWAATENGGISIIRRPRKLFEHHRIHGQGGNPAKFNTVLCFFEEKEGGLWIGTEGEGLFHWDIDGNETQITANLKESNRLSHAIVTGIYQDKQGLLWVITFGGLNRLNPATGEVKQFVHDPSQKLSRASNKVFGIYDDGKGNLWLGTRGGGVAKFNMQSEAFTFFRHDPKDAISLGNNVVWQIISDKAGGMWIATDGGIDHLTFEEGKPVFEHFQHDPKNPNSISDAYINFILLGKDSSLWVGTDGSGINRLKWGNTGELTVSKFSRKDGLVDDVIYAMLEDDHGYLWITTNRGLSRFDPSLSADQQRGKAFLNFDKNDGLQDNEFNMGAYHRGQSGAFYIGGLNGFNRFFPDSLEDQSSPPDVVLSGFKILNEYIQPGQKRPYGNRPLVSSINHVNEVNLSHRDYAFTIEFAALDHWRPNECQFAYIMEGFDEAWTYCGNRSFATYTNLDAGDYSFRVKASNSEGAWNETGRQILIQVKPAPWKTWWAYLLYFLAAAGIGYGLFKFRIEQHKKEIETKARIEQAKIDERERVRKNTSADFHDELGHQLTRVNLFVSMAKRLAGKSEDLMEYLDKIQTNTKGLSEGMRDFIWVLDPEKDTLMDATLRLKEFGDSLFEPTDTAFRFEVVEPEIKDIGLPLDKRRHLMFLFKEAMNNAAKYANAREVILSIHRNNGEIEMELKDDGVGFDLAQNSDGYGLKNMVSRAEKIEGKVKVESQPGNGTVISVLFPIPHMGD